MPPAACNASSPHRRRDPFPARCPASHAQRRGGCRGARPGHAVELGPGWRRRGQQQPAAPQLCTGQVGAPAWERDSGGWHVGWLRQAAGKPGRGRAATQPTHQPVFHPGADAALASQLLLTNQPMPATPFPCTSACTPPQLPGAAWPAAAHSGGAHRRGHAGPGQRPAGQRYAAQPGGLAGQPAGRRRRRARHGARPWWRRR